MNRTNPTFKQQTSLEEENVAFVDELFDELFASLTDNDTINSDTDKVPDLGKFES